MTFRPTTEPRPVAFPRWLVLTPHEPHEKLAVLSGKLTKRQAKNMAVTIATATGDNTLMVEERRGASNPTLVHHGLAKGAAFHITSTLSGPVADVYGSRPMVARAIAQLVSNAIGEQVEVTRNTLVGKGSVHSRVDNRLPRERFERPSRNPIEPVPGEVWTTLSGDKARVITVTNARVQVLHLDSGNRAWIGRSEFLAEYRPPRTRPNPSRSKGARAGRRHLRQAYNRKTRRAVTRQGGTRFAFSPKSLHYFDRSRARAAGRSPNPAGRDYPYGGREVNIGGHTWLDLTRKQWAAVPKDHRDYSGGWGNFYDTHGEGVPYVSGSNDASGKWTGMFIVPVRITDAKDMGRRAPAPNPKGRDPLLTECHDLLQSRFADTRTIEGRKATALMNKIRSANPNPKGRKQSRGRLNPAVHFDRKTLPETGARIVAAAFPSYRGNKFQLSYADSIHVNNLWSEGSKEDTVFVRLDTLEVYRPPDTYHAGAQETPIPEGVVAVQHVRFRGEDLGIRFVAPPGAARFFPAPASDVTEDELIVLDATRSYKSSYGGRTDNRYSEANHYTGITLSRWNAAVGSLMERGLLNKARAITTAGKNAVGDFRLDRMRRNPRGGPRVVFNRLLGGWYVVTGPHQTPLNGRFNSKAQAQAWLAGGARRANPFGHPEGEKWRAGDRVRMAGTQDRGTVLHWHLEQHNDPAKNRMVVVVKWDRGGVVRYVPPGHLRLPDEPDTARNPAGPQEFERTGPGGRARAVYMVGPKRSAWWAEWWFEDAEEHAESEGLIEVVDGPAFVEAWAETGSLSAAMEAGGKPVRNPKGRKPSRGVYDNPNQRETELARRLVRDLGFGAMAEAIRTGEATVAETFQHLIASNLLPESRKVLLRSALVALDRGHGSRAELAETRRAAFAALAEEKARAAAHPANRTRNPRRADRPGNDRDFAIDTIKAGLQKRSGHAWSVTPGKGTSWGWIRITLPPGKRMWRHRLKPGMPDYPENYEGYDSGQPGGSMSPAQRAELAALLGLEVREVHGDGISLSGGSGATAWREEYMDRAQGKAPSVRGEVDFYYNPRRVPNPRGRKASRGSEVARAKRTAQMWNEFPATTAKRVRIRSRTIPSTLVKLGDIHSVVYRSNKYDGKHKLHEHRFKRPLPVLTSDPDGRAMHIVGGGYSITGDGIVN